MSLRRHLTFANAMSLVAVFIALTAGAYAAGLGRNSVKSKQIKDGAVATQDLADAAVTGPKVLDGSVGSVKLADGAVNGAKVADGSLNGADVGDDSLTGADIAEASLQGVNATSADSIGGLTLKKIDYQSPIQNGVVRNILEFPGVFRIDAQCANNGDGLDISAVSGVEDAKLFIQGVRATAADDADGVKDISSAFFPDFDTNEVVGIDNILPTPVAGDQATIRLSTPSGFTVKANFWTNELSTTCTITGTAIGG
jgi:hypothetical protein